MENVDTITANVARDHITENTKYIQSLTYDLHKLLAVDLTPKQINFQDESTNPICQQYQRHPLICKIFLLKFDSTAVIVVDGEIVAVAQDETMHTENLSPKKVMHQ